MNTPGNRGNCVIASFLGDCEVSAGVGDGPWVRLEQEITLNPSPQFLLFRRCCFLYYIRTEQCRLGLGSDSLRTAPGTGEWVWDLNPGLCLTSPQFLLWQDSRSLLYRGGAGKARERDLRGEIRAAGNRER